MVTETGLAVALRFRGLLDFAEILFKEENTAEHPAQNEMVANADILISDSFRPVRPML